jgi:hypothetical protein
MESQQITELLLAIQEEINAQTETMLASMDVHQTGMDADSKAWREEVRARTEAMREERMKANMDACIADIKYNREETMACQEKMEAPLEEKKPVSEDMVPEVAHEEVPAKDAVVMSVGEPRKRRRDQRHLAAQCRQKEGQ